MKCNERKCGRCSAPVATWVEFILPGQTVGPVCADCLAGHFADEQVPVDDTGLVEARCEGCQNLFATDPEYAAWFCSLTCELVWKAARTFDTVPW